MQLSLIFVLLAVVAVYGGVTTPIARPIREIVNKDNLTTRTPMDSNTQMEHLGHNHTKHAHGPHEGHKHAMDEKIMVPKDVIPDAEEFPSQGFQKNVDKLSSV